ncbi:MAG: helix-turn-helix transcriptional regulator [Verrucomicrobia bacterium]|nr:helix-turn-helix transcriptional regulator [Verrucomicrobiota bacterium]
MFPFLFIALGLPVSHLSLEFYVCERLLMAISKLGEALAKARGEKGWSQQTLSEKARVSSRTVFMLEKGERAKARADVVVKLATAVGKDPEDWLKLAGLKDFPREEVERIQGGLGSFKLKGESDPVAFFQGLKKKVAERKWPVAFCAAYTSLPGAVHRQDVRQYFVDLLNGGLVGVALVSPYPHVPAAVQSAKPYLAAYYSAVQNEVLRLALELKRAVSNEDAAKRLAVYAPMRHDEGKVRFDCPPTPGLGEYRTALLKHFCPEAPEVSEYELVNWTRLTGDNKDRILRVFPPAEPEYQENAYNLVLRWEDYFRELLECCEPGKKRFWTREVAGEWKKLL